MKETVLRLIGELKAMGSKTTQDLDEFSFLFHSIKNTGATSYIEIGSEFGGSLWVLAHAMPIGSIIQSVDYPLNDEKRKVLERIIERLNEKGYIASLITGDSHSPEIINQVKAMYEPGTFDVMFIDGDHSYKGVKQDYVNYSELVKDGGIISFHDVSIPYDKEQTQCDKTDYDTRVQKRRDVEVSLFWQNVVVEEQFKSIEINNLGRNRYGVGMMQKNVIGSYRVINSFDNNYQYTFWK